MVDLKDWQEQMQARWAPLRDQCAFAAGRGGELAGFQEDTPFEVGSTFKAFVAAEYARQVAEGRIDPDMHLTVQPVDRVDSSIVLNAVPDGDSISIQEAAEAMIGASDNTATDLVVRVVGVDRVRALLEELGLSSTTIPDSTRSIYDRVKAEPDWRPESSVITMRDLACFYTATIAERALGDAATDRFLTLMREEDLVQGASWPNGVTCYRKSGMVEPPPLLAMGMAGAFVSSDGEVITFAFALNTEFPEDASFEDSPLEPTVRTFSEGLRRGLHDLAGGDAA